MLSWYLLMSLLFVFGTVFEFILVLIIKQVVEWAAINKRSHTVQYGLKTNVLKERQTWKKNQCNVEILEEISTTSGNTLSTSNSRHDATNFKFFKNLSIASKIDYVTFVVFISFFFMFNCIYDNTL